jgi:hypothetical protein
VLTFKCPKGGALLQAFTLSDLAAKRSIHDEFWHSDPSARCRSESERQNAAPLLRAYHNESARGVTTGGQ